MLSAYHEKLVELFIVQVHVVPEFLLSVMQYATTLSFTVTDTSIPYQK